MAFTKTRKKYVQVMATGDMKSQSLTKIQIFVLLSHDFQITTSIRRSKFTFSCIIQPIFSENEKKKYFNNVLDTYICFQSSNFIHWVTFCPKRAKIQAPISWEQVGITENDWKWRKFEDITSRLCPCTSQKMALKNNLFCYHFLLLPMDVKFGVKIRMLEQRIGNSFNSR